VTGPRGGVAGGYCAAQSAALRGGAVRPTPARRRRARRRNGAPAGSRGDSESAERRLHLCHRYLVHRARSYRCRRPRRRHHGAVRLFIGELTCTDRPATLRGGRYGSAHLLFAEITNTIPSIIDF